MHRRALSKDGVVSFLFSIFTITILYLLPLFSSVARASFWLRMKDELLMIDDNISSVGDALNKGLWLFLEGGGDLGDVHCMAD
jgi:hypothetical protein